MGVPIVIPYLFVCLGGPFFVIMRAGICPHNVPKMIPIWGQTIHNKLIITSTMEIISDITILGEKWESA